MARIDLHVHSQYSKHPAQWFLQRVGTQESYTKIEEVYTIAKNRGMDFVTLTDHNTIEALEKLLLLFDVFEGINGARNVSYNTIWKQALMNLTPEDIDRLYDKHRIEPFSETSWLKGFTGGSDDHAGLFIGQTFTMTEGNTIEDSIRNIKEKRTNSEGRSSDFKMMAFTIYKVACDFSKCTAAKKSGGLLELINSLLFENKRPGFRSRLVVKRIKSRKNHQDQIVTRFLDDLFTDFRHNGTLSIEEKINKIYDNIAVMTDNFFAVILESLEHDLKNGDINGLIKNFFAVLPVIFLSVPFFSTKSDGIHARKLVENA